MRVSKCYFCGSEQRSFYAKENGFTLVKCASCGLLFVENRPNDNEITQAHIHGKHCDPDGVTQFDITGKFDSRQLPRYLEVLNDLFPAREAVNCKNWLDVGCGHGEFMAAVQQFTSAWPGGVVTVEGTDPNVHKMKSAQERGLNVFSLNINSHKQKYDVISLLNVWSHLTDPPNFLSSLKTLLNPKGLLILETGDVEDMEPMDHFGPFYLPDHLSFASERIVVGILERLDFNILRIKKYPVLRLDITVIGKQVVKAILPHYQSNLLACWKEMFSSQKRDMFILASLKM